MFALFNRLADRHTCPIGIDLGSHTFKAVQVERVHAAGANAAGWRVIASVALPVPAGTWSDATSKRAFFAGPVRRALSAGGFRGRQAVLALPAAATFVTGLRLPPAPATHVGAGVADALAGTLPFPVRHAVIKHFVAGDAYERGELRHAVIAMAVRRGLVEDCLAAAAAARLQIVAMPCEPSALLAALPNPTASGTRMIVDLCAGETRAYAVRAGRLVFARRIDGGSSSEAALRRTARELSMCRHYVEAPLERPVGEIIFVGGGAHQREHCQRLAGALGLPFRVVAPDTSPARGSTAAATAAAGPEWAVAVGASLTPSKAGRVHAAA